MGRARPSLLPPVALLRCGGEGRRSHIVKEEATSVSHRRIDGDDGDVPPGPEHVPLFVATAAAAAAEDDRGAAVNGQGATQVGDV